MNKNKINGLLAIAGIFMLMITAASVNAGSDDEPGVLDRESILYDDSSDSVNGDMISDEVPNLISPGPDNDDLEDWVIAPAGSQEKQEQSSNVFTSDFMLVLVISGVVGLVLGLMIFKRKE